MTNLNFEEMTGAEVEAALAALRKIKKDAQEAQKERYAELARELVETVLTEHGCQASEYSDRVGYSTPSLSIEVDGREHTFYLAIKDVTASKERAEAIKRGDVVLKKKESKKSSSSSEEKSED